MSHPGIRIGDSMQTQLPTQKSSELDSGGEYLHDYQERFRFAFELAGTGMGFVDPRGKFFEVNQKLCDLFGFAKEELLRMTLSDLPVPMGDTPAQYVSRIAAEFPRTAFEKRFVSRQGIVVWAEVSYGPVFALPDQPACSLACFHDITERKLHQIALEQQAWLDPLTRAFNRLCFEDRASIELLRADRHHSRLSLVLIDLDHFKQVNDNYGHPAGDEVLRIFGEITRSCLRVMDLLGRWGGEEFLILLPDTGPASARRVSERIRTLLESYSFPSGARVTASLGVATLRVEDSFASLVARADAAMYQAKQGGRNRVVVNADDMRLRFTRRPDRLGLPELRWRKLYASGLPQIDIEHQGLFEAANRVISALGADGERGEVAPLITNLLARIADHFEHEEKLLEGYGYPQFETHRRSHRKLLDQANKLVDRYQQKEATAGALMGFVIHDVVARHMNHEDQEFLVWLKDSALAIQQ